MTISLIIWLQLQQRRSLHPRFHYNITQPCLIFASLIVELFVVTQREVKNCKL